MSLFLLTQSRVADAQVQCSEELGAPALLVSNTLGQIVEVTNMARRQKTERLVVTAPGQMFYNIAVSPDGKLYGVTGNGSKAALFEVDWTTGARTQVANYAHFVPQTDGAIMRSNALTFGPDNKAYIASSPDYTRIADIPTTDRRGEAHRYNFTTSQWELWTIFDQWDNRTFNPNDRPIYSAGDFFFTDGYVYTVVFLETVMPTDMKEYYLWRFAVDADLKPTSMDVMGKFSREVNGAGMTSDGKGYVVTSTAVYQMNQIPTTPGGGTTIIPTTYVGDLDNRTGDPLPPKIMGATSRTEASLANLPTCFSLKASTDIAAGTTVNPGTKFTYTLTIMNDSKVPSTGGDKVKATSIVVEHVAPLASYTDQTSQGSYSNSLWTVGDLAQGKSATLKMTVDVGTSSPMDIIAQVKSVDQTSSKFTPDNLSGDPSEPDETKASVTVVAGKSTDLDLAMISDASGPVDIGKDVVFTLTATNKGPDAASNVVVTDKLPDGFTFKSADSADYDDATGKWNLGALAKDGTKTLKITATVNANGDYKNVATVAGADTDPDTSNNQAEVSITATANSDLALSMTSDASGPVDIGKDVVFTLTVTNKGPDAASNVVVTDKLPDGFTFKSADSTDYDGGTGKWTVGALAKDGTKTLKITATVNANGDYKNVATVAGTETDPDTSNNQAEVEVQANRNTGSDLSIAMISDAGTVYAGKDVIFTLTVKNNGPDAASNVVVTDKLPDGFTFVSADSADYDDGTGKWTVGALAKDETKTLAITATVNVNGDYKNVATVAGDQMDLSTGNDTTSVEITATANSDLSIAMTSDAGTVFVGKHVVFTLTATNNGPSAATGIVVTDKLPSGLALDWWTIDPPTSYDDETGKWTIPNLAKGESAEFKITAKVNPSGDYKNVASVAGDQMDLSTGNDTTSVEITATANSDLALSMTSDASGPVDIGKDVVFTLTVINKKGPSDASNVVVTDKLPDGFTFVTADSADYDDVTGKWTVGALAKDGTKTLKITATVNASGDYKNVATVAGTETDLDTSNNQAEVSITAQANSDLALSMTSDAGGPVDVGKDVVFTLTATNKGPEAASNVVVTNNLPDGFTFKSTDSADYDDVTGKWTVGALAKDGTKTLTITATVNPKGDYKNVATVAGAGADPDTSNNQAEVSITAQANSDLALSMTSGAGGSVDVGKDVVFTLTVTNKGPSDASNVVVTDKLPDGFTFKSTDSADYDDGTGKWTVGALAKDGTKTLTITATVNANGDYKNVATVAGTETDPDTSNNQAEVSITAQANSDLALSMISDASGPVDIGKDVVFTLTVTNKGPSDASNVVVTDKLPDGFTFVSADSTDYDDGTGKWTVGALAKDGTKTLKITATVNASGDYKNVATVAGTETDLDTSNNQAEVEVQANRKTGSDLSIAMTSDAGTVFAGKDVVFTLTATNKGPEAASNVVVTDKLPDGFTFVSADSADYDDGTGKWTIGDLPKDGTKTLAITARVNASGDHKNVATVAGDQMDLSTGNDTISVEITVTANSDLALSMTSDASGLVDIGKDVVFTLTVTNKGPSDASNVFVTDKLPDGFTFKSDDSTDYDDGTGKWTIGALAKDGTKTLKITATVNASGDHKNVATVAGDEHDLDPRNDKKSLSIKVDHRIDLELDQKIVPDETPYGSKVTITLTLNNKGPSTATGIAVINKLPSGLTFDSGNIPYPTDYSLDTGKWTIPNLAKGESTWLNITATVNRNGDYKNKAEVTEANEQDIDSIVGNADEGKGEDDETEVELTNFGSVDLQISTIAIPVVAVNEGDSVNVAITASNKGNADAAQVSIDTDRFKDLFCQTTTALGNPFSSDGSAATFEAGDSVSCVASMRTTSSDAAAGKISVPIRLTGKGLRNQDVTPAVNTLDIVMSSYKGNNQISNMLELKKMVSAVDDADQSNSLTAGDTVRYDLVVRNKGAQSIQGVTITDSALDSFACPSNDLDINEVMSCQGSYLVQGSDAGKVWVNTGTTQDTKAEHDGVDSASILVEDGNLPELPFLSFRQVITRYQDLDKDNALSVGDSIDYKMIMTNGGNTSVGSISLDVPWLKNINCSPTLDSTTVLKPAQTLECTSSYSLQDADVKGRNALFAPVADVSARPVGTEAIDTLSIHASDRAGLVIMKDPKLIVEMVSLPAEGIKAGSTLVYSSIIKHDSNSVGSAGSVQIEGGLNGIFSDKDCSLYVGNKPITSPQPWKNDGSETLANNGSYIECLSYKNVEAGDFKSGSISNFTEVSYKISGTGTPLSSTSTHNVSEISTGSSKDISVVSYILGSAASSGDDPATTHIDESQFWGAGDTVTWEVNVANTSSERIDSWGTTSSLQGATLDCPDKSSILPGESRVCTYRYDVTQADEVKGFISNVVDVYGDKTTANMVSAPNVSSSTLAQPNKAGRVNASTQTSLPTSPEIQAPGLALAVMITGNQDLDGNKKVTVGDILEYKLIATNMGHTSLRDVEITDGLSKDLSCKSSSLTVGESKICPVSYTIKSSDVDEITGSGDMKNSVIAKALNANGDQILKTRDQFSIPLTGAVLSVSLKTIPNKSVQLDDNILHLIQVKNSGSVDADNVTLSSADLSSFSCAEKTKNGQNFTIGGTLLSGDRIVCVSQRTVKQTDVAAGDILSRVKVEADGIKPKSAEITLPVKSKPSKGLLDIKVSLSKDEPAPKKVGDTVYLDIVVSNASRQSINNVALNAPGVFDLDCKPHTLPIKTLNVGEAIHCTGKKTATEEDIERGILTTPVKGSGVQEGEPVEEKGEGNVLVVETSVPQIEINAWLDSYEDKDKGGFVSPDDILTFKMNIENVGTAPLDKVALMALFSSEGASAGANMATLKNTPNNQPAVICEGAGNVPTILNVGQKANCSVPYTVLDTDVSPGDRDAVIIFSVTATGEGPGPDGGDLTVSASEYASVSSGGATSTLGVAKNLTDFVYDPDKDNTAIMTFDFVVGNMGGTTRADEIQLLDDLEMAFADSYQSIDVLSCPQSVGTTVLTPNCDYSGQGDDKQLLKGTDSLDAGESGQIRMVVSVTFKDIGPRQITNIATINAKTPAGIDINDVATNGLNPDPNSDEIPDESFPTIFDVVPSQEYVTMTKVSSSTQVERGNPVGFVLSATNTLATPIMIDVVDLMPPGFNYRANTAKVRIGDESVQAKEPEIEGTYLWWKDLELDSQKTVTIELIAVPSVGAKEGKYRNQACAAVDGVCVSNKAWADISVIPSGIFDCSTVLGRVFVDSNSDGVHNDGEVGLPGVRLGSPDGLFIYPDSKGKFSVPCADTPDIAKGSNYVLKLDESTLPVGYALTTENPRAIRLTAGKAVAMNFGVAKRCNINMALEEGAFVADSVRMHNQWAVYLNDVLGTISLNPNAECILDVNLVACGKENSDLNIRRAQLLGSYLKEQWAEMGNRPLNTDVRLISQIRKNCESNRVQLPSSLPESMAEEATEVVPNALNNGNMQIPGGYTVFRNSRGNLLLAPKINQ